MGHEAIFLKYFKDVSRDFDEFRVNDIYLLLSIPFNIRALLSRFLPVATQTRGHVAGPPPPSPLRYMPSFFLSREELSIFVPRRLASNCAYPRSKVLSVIDAFFFLNFAHKNVKSHHGGNRTQVPNR